MAPLYISVAWTLMVSYQFFTQTSVMAVIAYVNAFWPSVGEWLVSRMDMIVFIHAFAWVFLLSSAIPSIILGKERGVLVQFSVCLIITLLAFVLQDALTAFGGGLIGQIFSLAILFRNPFLATCYLLIPYLLMIGFDIYCRRKRKKKEKKDDTITVCPAYVAEEDDEVQEEEIMY